MSLCPLDHNDSFCCLLFASNELSSEPTENGKSRAKSYYCWPLIWLEVHSTQLLPIDKILIIIHNKLMMIIINNNRNIPNDWLNRPWFQFRFKILMLSPLRYYLVQVLRSYNLDSPVSKMQIHTYSCKCHVLFPPDWKKEQKICKCMWMINSSHSSWYARYANGSLKRNRVKFIWIGMESQCNLISEPSIENGNSKLYKTFDCLSINQPTRSNDGKYGNQNAILSSPWLFLIFFHIP